MKQNKKFYIVDDYFKLVYKNPDRESLQTMKMFYYDILNKNNYEYDVVIPFFSKEPHYKLTSYDYDLDILDLGIWDIESIKICSDAVQKNPDIFYNQIKPMFADDVIKFGKYKGKKLKDINDPNYLHWLKVNNIIDFIGDAKKIDTTPIREQYYSNVYYKTIGYDHEDYGDGYLGSDFCIFND